MSAAGVARELYVSDLDGTLLGPEARLSDFARRAVTRVVESGAAFTVASARSVQSMRPILGDLPLRLPVVAMNGAFLSDLRTGRHELIQAMTAADAGPVLDAAGRLGLEPFVTSYDGHRDNLYLPAPRNPGMEWYVGDRRGIADPRLRDGYESRCWLSEQIATLTFIDSRARLEPLLEVVAGAAPVLGSVFTPHIYTSGGWYWLTVHSGAVSKDRAVDSLRKRRGLEGLRVVAFGDQANDVPLLRYADHAVAVANADPEARAEADEVIGANSEDAVPRWILARLGLD
jgi:Cof subfamily protein (haloacid dehalogenase superfamily)